jgi:hypothetical protein
MANWKDGKPLWANYWHESVDGRSVVEIFVPHQALAWATEFCPDFRSEAEWLFRIGVLTESPILRYKGTVLRETPWTDPEGRVGAIMYVMLTENMKPSLDNKIFKDEPREVSERQREEFWEKAKEVLSGHNND